MALTVNRDRELDYSRLAVAAAFDEGRQMAVDTDLYTLCTDPRFKKLLASVRCNSAVYAMPPYFEP